MFTVTNILFNLSIFWAETRFHQVCSFMGSKAWQLFASLYTARVNKYFWLKADWHQLLRVSLGYYENWWWRGKRNYSFKMNSKYDAYLALTCTFFEQMDRYQYEKSIIQFVIVRSPVNKFDLSSWCYSSWSQTRFFVTDTTRNVVRVSCLRRRYSTFSYHSFQ